MIVRKRLYLSLVVLLVVLAGAVLWQAWPQREPAYQGKRLSAWLSQYTANHWSATTRDNDLDKQAQSAIQQIGTNAIPILVRMLRTRDSALKVRIMGVLAKQRIISIQYMSARRWNWAATAGFQVLGAKAESAVPALVQIVNENITPTSQASAIRCLGSIGPPAKNAVSLLLPFTASSNNDVRFSSVYALAEIGAEPERTVPVLIRGLGEWDPDVQTKVLSALESFGPDAKPAVPALLELLNRPGSPLRVDRMLVTNALKRIDPEAAARAGVK